MKRKLFILIGAFFCFLIIITVALVLSNKRTTLKIGVMTDVDSVQVAVAAHLCKNVEIITFADSFARTSAFRNGSVDICVSDMLTATREINGGQNNKILTTTSGDYCLVSRYDNLPESALSVGISTGTVIEFAADKIFAETSFKKIPISNISARYSALLLGTVNSCVLPEPYASLCEEKGYKILSRMGQNQLGVLTLSEKSVGKSDLVNEFLKGFEQAAEICNTLPYSREVTNALTSLSLPQNTKLPTYKNVCLPSDSTVNELITYLYKTDKILIDSNKITGAFWKFSYTR